MSGSRSTTIATLALAIAGCADEAGVPAAGDPRAEVRQRLEVALESGMRRIAVLADSMDGSLQPLPLLTSGQEASLRRYLNPQQLQRARALGVPRPSRGELAALQRDGRLVALEASTEHWIAGEFDLSAPLVTPDAHALLAEVGERFQDRLGELGLPPYRLEVSSALRTAEDQAELRQTNPNAVGGVSTHEYGTTLDVLYSRFAPPRALDEWIDTGGVPWLEAHLRRVAVIAAERLGGRRSHELKAILGQVLLRMQSEGKVMVTLERQQPVYHMTVARRY